MAKSALLIGQGRLEHWKLAGRKIRSGSLDELKPSDQELLIQWIRQGRKSEAVDMLEILRPLYLDMTTVLLEWSLAYAEVLRADLGSEVEAKVSTEAYKKWKPIVESEMHSEEQKEAGPLLLDLLKPRPIKTKEDRLPTAEKINAGPLQTWSACLSLVEQGSTDAAIKSFEKFVAQSQARHDFLCQYLWVYPSVLNDFQGQEVSEDLMQRSFQTCTMYKSFLAFMEKLSPEGIVAFVAEHLRGHFSGPGRTGAVEIIEESDRYRLIFDACGSGGAMRRKAVSAPQPGLDNYKKASFGTWGMTDKVPTFCAHCAHNEVAMIESFGYPGWVVDFNPDPMKPCGWTVFKDLSKVPKEYYERVGMQKDEAKIQGPPKD